MRSYEKNICCFCIGIGTPVYSLYDSAECERITRSHSTVPDIPSMDFDFTKSDLNGEYTETGAVYIVFSGDTAQITGKGAFASGSSVTIESDGTYIISGESDNAMLTVNADKEVKLQHSECRDITFPV